MSLILALFVALAAPPDAEPPVRPEPAEMALATDTRASIALAIERRRAGDTEGARALLVEIEPLVASEDRSWYLYQRGVTEELSWNPAEARAFYEQVLAIDGAEAIDARFRHALVLEDLGDDAGALEDILLLAKLRGLDERDETTVALQRGITEVNTRRVRRGVARIEAALATVEGGTTHRYMRAKARYTLAQALLDEADRLRLKGSQKRIVRNLTGRAERIKAAEQQVIALVALEEPEWILASLIALGDSYGRLSDELRATPAPRKLTDEQEAIYREQLAKKAENVKTKAYHSYDQGVTLATRLAFESPRLATLKERRAALEGER